MSEGTSFFRTFENELDGQEYFYKKYLLRVDSSLSYDDLFDCYSDGVVNGCILEFKLVLNYPNQALFQVIKYLSAMRIKGKNIPKHILLVSLNTNEVYVYDSEEYLSYIEKVYIGAASKNNSEFVANEHKHFFDLSIDKDVEKMIELLKKKEFVPIHIDENCIVGWAERYYRENPGSKKADFIGDENGVVKIIGEIRKPTHFKGLIIPYKGKSNSKFEYLMDKLNDFFQKKNLGAFYTPVPYVEKSIELLREAIKRVPSGNDYVIIDRCAGTGNLEKRLSDEELSHCIVSTIEYYEYKVLMEKLGDKVRHIIPPTEKEDTFNMGLVRGADALSKEFIENDVIMEYVNMPNCTIILFENPPYSETTSLEHQRKGKGKESSIWKKSYVVSQMRSEVKGPALNDLGNAFIWSAFKYYLRQPEDSYIVYSPVKYWKAQHLINKKFEKGFAFNRKHFHTNIDACVMCAWWSNVDDCNNEVLSLDGFDIDKKNCLVPFDNEILVKKIHSSFSEKYYEKNKPDGSDDGILVGLNGLEINGDQKCRIRPLCSKDIIGYLVADSFGFDSPDSKSSLLIAGRYNGNGFFLKKDNFLEKLPLFAASRYVRYNSSWTERARIMKSGDGADRFRKDLKKKKVKEKLLKVLLFTCLETQNHMRSFMGSDGRFYRNELCLDSSNGETLATASLKSFVPNESETELLELYVKILEEVKKTPEYSPELTYGVYQIIEEINLFDVDDKNVKTYRHPILNGYLSSLKALIKRYYIDEIVPFLFEYEFLK